eukprot:TRINITY_DN13478_c0_g2_i10.p2 TRINITY_DN13478_c0_g2~~TRINITY_DN13478_c0_g2_i10.p2  ORF type:complete len:108 (+),score=5.02 TRINITY_DN13478_c0_g2_i10:374-697(+)
MEEDGDGQLPGWQAAAGAPGCPAEHCSQGPAGSTAAQRGLRARTQSRGAILSGDAAPAAKRCCTRGASTPGCCRPLQPHAQAPVAEALQADKEKDEGPTCSPRGAWA